MGFDYDGVTVHVLDEIERSSKNLRDVLREIERRALLLALRESNGNKAQAARTLKIKRTALIERCKAFGIELARDVKFLTAPERPEFYYDKCAALLRGFFESEEKVADWFSTKNLNFGGSAPIDLIKRHRGHKVLRFIETSLEENKR